MKGKENLTVSADYFKAIGEIVHHMNELELTMITAIAHFLDHDLNLTLTLMSGRNYSDLSATLLRLFQYRSDDIQKYRQLKLMLGKCDDCNARRNRYVHSVWYFDPGSVTNIKFPKGRSYDAMTDIQIESVNLTELTKLVADIERARNDLGEFIFRFAQDLGKHP